jgi:DNA-binding NarL/FixJ family response regulator
VFDTTLTVVLLVAGIVLLFTYTDDSGVPYRDGDVLGVLLVVLGTAAFLFRRRAAATVAAVVTASTFLLSIFDYASPTSIVVALVAVNSAGAYASFLSRLAAMAALVVSLDTSIAIAHARYPDAVGLDLPGAVFATLGFIGMWGIGRAVRGRRVYMTELEDRADRLERTREAEVRAALAEERARIARELHDVVALRSGRVGRPRHRRGPRAGGRSGRPPARARPARHAGAGCALRRLPARRSTARRRLRGAGADSLRRGCGMTVPAASPIRVLLVDDQPLLRTGFRVILETEPDIAVVGESGDGEAAVAAARALQPDLVLMDVRMPRMDGVQATRLITGAARDAAPRVLVLTTFDLDEYVVQALRGERERQVLKLVARGLSNAEMAAELVVSETTVKTHVGNLLTKLGVRDRVQAAVYAYESGLVRPGAL